MCLDRCSASSRSLSGVLVLLAFLLAPLVPQTTATAQSGKTPPVPALDRSRGNSTPSPIHSKNGTLGVGGR